jgi:hypothetical protein
MWHSILCHDSSYVWDLVPAHLVIMFAPGFWTPKIRVWHGVPLPPARRSAAPSSRCSLASWLPARLLPPLGAPCSLGPSSGDGFPAPSVPPPGAPCSLGPSFGGGFPAQPAKVTFPCNSVSKISGLVVVYLRLASASGLLVVNRSRDRVALIYPTPW